MARVQRSRPTPAEPTRDLLDVMCFPGAQLGPARVEERAVWWCGAAGGGVGGREKTG